MEFRASVSLPSYLAVRRIVRTLEHCGHPLPRRPVQGSTLSVRPIARLPVAEIFGQCLRFLIASEIRHLACAEEDVRMGFAGHEPFILAYA